MFLFQVHGHHPPVAAAHVIHRDQGRGRSDLVRTRESSSEYPHSLTSGPPWSSDWLEGMLYTGSGST